MGKKIKVILLVILSAFSAVTAVDAQKRPPAKAAATKTIILVTEPNSTVWIDEVLRGKTDETGKLIIRNITPAAHRLRIRAAGFSEINQTLTAAQKGEIKISLTKTSDEAELAFQQAEAEKNKQKAVGLYRKAVELRPKYAEAFVAIARLLSEADSEEALKAISDARKLRASYAEASAVEGRIYKLEGNEAKAIAAFKRAISEGKGFQPEAYTGLGLLYREKAELSSSDLEAEKANNILAANNLTIAAKQLSGAPDAEVVMQLLGGIYEKMRELKKAIAVYEEFLRVFPDSNERSAVESFIVQLKKEMSEQQ